MESDTNSYHFNSQVLGRLALFCVLALTDCATQPVDHSNIYNDEDAAAFDDQSNINAQASYNEISRRSLSGWNEFKFGMTLGQIVEIASQSPNLDGALSLTQFGYLTGSTTINSVPVYLQFYFLAPRTTLSAVYFNLQPITSNGSDDCTEQNDPLVQSLVKEYGPYSIKMDQKDGAIYALEYLWTFKDSSNIDFYDPHSCAYSRIEYFAAPSAPVSANL